MALDDELGERSLVRLTGEMRLDIVGLIHQVLGLAKAALNCIRRGIANNLLLVQGV